jgi:elongation factor G
VIGQDYDPVARLEAGSIGALLFEAGEAMPTTGETIGPTVLPFTFERLRPPEPVLSLPVEAPDAAAHARMLAEFGRLCEDDPSLRLGTDRESGRALLSGMGELHLEIARQRASRALGFEIKAGHPQVRARRFLAAAGRGEALVSHPTGRARVRVEVAAEPWVKAQGAAGGVAIEAPALERPEWRDAVVSGLESAAGLDGRGAPQLLEARLSTLAVEHHGSDVVPVMFRDAAEWAALRAIEAAGPLVAEPWCTLVVIAPDAAIGRVVGDLARRGGRVRRSESRGAMQELTVEAPLAQLIGYASDLRSITAGRGPHSVEPTGYRRAGED